ncbi:MAG: efflux RND transporter permease subunit [Phycisphaerae bacterium]|nr:efflux RND transporter permease subunit [Phycisphaerae bacterium]
MIISDIAIKNRTTVGVLVALILISGTVSYITLPREAFPDVPIPFITISTTYEGVAPQDVESSVTMKIEKKLVGIKGVKEIRSTSMEGESLITLEFLPDVRVEDALQYVRDKVDQAKADLPTDAEDPVIREISVAEFPVIIANIAGPISPVRLKAIADELQDAIEVVPGVLKCDVLGALEREIRLEIDPDRVAAYGLTIPELLSLIPSENVNISAGGLETPGVKFNVRVPAEFAQPEEVDHLLLTVRNGKPIYLTDVASVNDTFKDPLSFSRLDGANAITLAVQKRVGANIVSIARTVKAILAHAQQQVPQGVKIDLTLDFSDTINRTVADLENNIATGALLILAVLMIFMGLRVSAIVALAIPLSMLMGFAIIQALGYTLNMVMLFGLILAVGMLVDNAIVIVENIYRHMQLGYGRVEAAMKGTSEVAWPVITSTLTTVAAFLPLMFWPGIVGHFLRYLPICVTITLSCSLFVAMVISPTICAMVSPGRVARARKKHWFLDGYRRFLRLALSHRRTVLALGGMLLVGVGLLYGLLGHGVVFFPQADPERAVVDIRCPQGTNIRHTDELTRLVEQRVEPYRFAWDSRTGQVKQIKHVVAGVGSAGGMSLAGAAAGPHLANVTLLFPDFEVRPRPSAEIITDIRRSLADISGAEVAVQKEEHGPPTGEDVTIRIIGPDFRVLEQLSDQVTSAIAGTPGLVNLRSDLELTRPELAFHVDRRKAMLLGVNTAIVGNFLKTTVFGSKVGTYRQFNDEYDITIRLPVSQRTHIDDILRLRVPNTSGQAVPLSELGDFTYTGGFGQIHRINQKRAVTVTGAAEGRLPNDVLKDVQDRLGLLVTPPGYELRYAGKEEEQQKASAFLKKAFGFACLLIVLILVAQFNTLTVPLIIMTTVVMSMIGVFVGLIVYAMPFGIIMTGIGVISLAGVVVNNAIVLLDYTRQLQRRGMNLIEASVEAGATRLRPVFLTAITTVLGLVPMLVGVSFDFHTFTWALRSESSEWWRSMAVAVVFGLGLATVLTLVVVPTLYVSLYRLAARWGLGGLTRPGAEPQAAPLPSA